jgi:lipopolysaccharide transport protein LptA
MNWQRRARFVLGLFLVGFAALLYVATRPRTTPAPPPPAPRTDPEAATETVPGTLTLESGDTIAFERLLTYRDGRSVARHVTATLHDPDGRRIVIQGQEAWQQVPSARRIGHLTVRGTVTASTSDGLVVRAGEMQYDEESALLTVPGSVDFVQHRVSGSGTGARYDRRGRRLAIAHDARVRLASEPTAAFEATAATVEFSRPDHTIRAEGRVQVTETDRTMDAETAVFYLTPDDAKLTAVVLEGTARVRLAAEAARTPGGLTEMAADRLELRYADDGQALREAHLAGRARLEWAGHAGGGGRRVQAGTIDATLGADGRSLVTLLARARVRLDLPAAAGRAAQLIRAEVLDAQGSDQGGLRTARFTGGVVFEEAALGSSPRRSARAPRLTLAFGPDGDVSAAEFAGGVTFAAGQWRAEAASVQYDPARGRVSLSAAAPEASPPWLNGDRLAVGADRIELTLDPERLTASGHVRSVVTAGAPAGAARGADRAHLPALLDEKRPVYVTAATLAYDAQAATGTYGGSVRLWQGTNVIRGEQLTLDERRGNLEVTGGAAATLALAAGAPDGGERRLVGTSERLEYDDQATTLRYRGAAHVEGPAGDLRADSIAVVLSADGRDLLRVEAAGLVEVRLEGGYRGTAGRLTYLPADERYRLEGPPVRLVEERGGKCRETTGVVLTFTRSADTISVDGTEGNRSRTRPVACTERRP